MDFIIPDNPKYCACLTHSILSTDLGSLIPMLGRKVRHKERTKVPKVTKQVRGKAET